MDTAERNPRQLVYFIGLPFAILFICAWVLFFFRGDLPLRIPIHFGVNGNPNFYVTTSTWHVFLPLIFGAITDASVIIMMFLIMARFDPSKKSSAHAEYTSLLFFETTMAVSVTVASISLLPFFFRGHNLIVASQGAIFLIIFLFLLLIVVTSILGAKRLSDHSYRQGNENSAGCWKLGFIYYNPQDPSIWEKKQIGVGVTLNFGHAAAYFILITIMATALGFAYLMSFIQGL